MTGGPHLLRHQAQGRDGGAKLGAGGCCRPCQSTCTGPGGAVVKRRMRKGGGARLSRPARRHDSTAGLCTLSRGD